MLKEKWDTKVCDITLASVDDLKFKAQKVILSASSIFFKKLLEKKLKSSFNNIHEKNLEQK